MSAQAVAKAEPRRFFLYSAVMVCVGFSTCAHAQGKWLNDDMPKYREYSTGVGAKGGGFGLICREDNGVKVLTYYFRVTADNTCGKDTRVVVDIDGQRKEYNFICDEDGSRVSLLKRSDSIQSSADMAQIQDRIKNARRKRMVVSSYTTKGSIEFGLAGAAGGIDRVVAICAKR